MKEARRLFDPSAPGWKFWIIRYGSFTRQTRYSKDHYFGTNGRTACGKVPTSGAIAKMDQLDKTGRCAKCHRLIAGNPLRKAEKSP